MLPLLAAVAMLAAADLSAVSSPQLMARAEASVAALGTYRLRFTKEERVGHKMIGPQVMDLVIRPSPLAIRAEVVSGPAKGRRFLYSAALRPKELRVQEGGLLALAGGLWLDIDHAWTREDTRHRVTELGLAPVLAYVQDDARKAAAAGGHRRTDVGREPRTGAWCIRYDAPPGVAGVYARSSLLCFDETTLLLRSAELSDERGVFERLQFEVRERQMQEPDVAFTPAGFGL